MTKGRVLRVLYLDDNDESYLDISDEFMKVIPLHSLGDVIQYQLKTRSGDNETGFDIVLCDVNMILRERDHPKDLFWGVSGDVRPYGPLLVLPLLHVSPISHFVPFSNYWSDPAVTSNGYVLVTLAIILSVMRGKHIDIAEAKEEMIARATGGGHDDISVGFPTDALVGIQDGLRGIRNKIKEGSIAGKFRISGAAAMRDQLRRWVKAGLRGEELQAVISKNKPRIQIIHSTTVWDSISVFSLCGDLLNFTEPHDAAELTPVLEVLGDWADLKGALNLMIDDVYGTAKRLLVGFSRAQDGDYPGPVDRRIPRSFGGNDRYLLVRATMLLAFTRAWYVVILQRQCGFRKIMERVYWFLGMDLLSDDLRAHRFNDLLGEHRRPFTGDDPWRMPFNARYEKHHDAYSLERDQPSSLDYFDRILCRQFIESRDVSDFDMGPRSKRVDWNPLRNPYPRWLTEQDDQHRHSLDRVAD